MFDYQLSGEIIVFKDTIQRDMPCVFPRFRNHESLFFVTDGTLLYEKEGEKSIVKKGQLGYIARGSIDSSSAYLCESVSYIAANFAFENNKDNLSPTLPFQTVCGLKPAHYEALFTKAYNIYISKLPAYHTLTKAVLLEIIGDLYNDFSFPRKSSQNIETIEIAIEYIKNHFSDSDFKISEIATVCKVSERNLRRLFTSVYNKGPFDFLQEFRINQAEILLANTNKTITQIALQCGFSDIYAFCHCYKKHRNFSPSAYRAEHF
ncbi:MAG: helix-turn-helix transcriptional regulator [Clostridia bacterium]|nr:helix-turn-helix transcriptional regulator [Clostridia bacterium]